MKDTIELKVNTGDLRITPEGQNEVFDGNTWIPLLNTVIGGSIGNGITSNQLIYNDSNISLQSPEPSYDFVLEMISKLSLEELQRLYAKKEHLITMIEKLILLKN